MPKINYFFEDITETPSLVFSSLSKWIEHVVKRYDQEIREINYIYCSDNYLLEINRSYLSHDYYTDIITFDHREEQNLPIEADIFISLDRVRENSQALETTFTDELHRVMIHGIHHLLGQSDKSDSEKLEMRKREEASLSLRQF